MMHAEYFEKFEMRDDKNEDEIRLSPADQKALAQALLDPPQAKSALERAARRHEQLVRRSDELRLCANL